MADIDLLDTDLPDTNRKTLQVNWMACQPSKISNDRPDKSCVPEWM